MCGIAGYIKLKNFEEAPFIESACALMRERGPDKQSFFKDDKVGLIHTRLSIIDLSEKGNQPIMNNRKNIVITFNGEIYNFRELKELLQKSYYFNSETDTEVILAGYELWGIEGLLDHLEGMFAFSIYDIDKRQIFLARDHFGKKPLYYYQDEDAFLFSSDIKVIHKAKSQRLEIDWNSVDYYFTELSVPQPYTIWKQVKQLSPASYLIFDLTTNTKESKKYWHLKSGPYHNLSLSDTIHEAKQLLTTAILKRTISDVPIGCFLSGGIDSGLVVSLLAQNCSQPINTFSVGLKHEKMNELPDARRVADKYGTKHHEIILDADVIEVLPKLLKYIGEPFADASLIPSFYICQALSGKVKVALSGDGGDEIFGGYENYGLAYRTDAYFSEWGNNPLRKVYALIDKLNTRIIGKGENAGAYEHYASLTGFERIYRQMGFSSKEKISLYTKEFLIQTNLFTENYLNGLWGANNDKLFVNTLMLASTQTRLLNDYLVKVDRSSMINSLEVRSPFLDKTLAEWAFSVPPSFKFYNKSNKYILKQIAKDEIGPDVFKQSKRGFGIPIGDWLKGSLKSFLLDYLNENSFLIKEGIIHYRGMQEILNNHFSSKSDNKDKIWALLCFEVWMRELK